MLLERAEIDPEKPTNHGRTPLSYAAGLGHAGVLLGREGSAPTDQMITAKHPSCLQQSEAIGRL